MQPSQPKKASRVILKIILLLVVPIIFASSLLYAVPRYYYDISDQIKLMNYQPPADIASLADSASMTSQAKQIFYVHKPELDDKDDFNNNCPLPELTFVLGCYTGSNIYILNIEQDELEPAEAVTAAHEMLHAAYVRLPQDERQQIDELLQAQFEAITDKRLIDLIEKYRAHDPKSIPTELHSILGTEVKDLSPELENHYSQYFVDRGKVVSAFMSYERIFASLENNLARIQNNLKSIKSKVDALEKTIEDQTSEVNDINARLDSLERSNNINAYNDLVPEQNRLVNSYNANIREYRSLIKDYNSQVDRHNDISVRHNDLLNSINSKYQEIDGKD